MPSNTTFRMFYFVYILQNQGLKRYTGYTSDLRKRLKDHESGYNFSSKSLRPFELIYFEGCLNKQDAQRREKYLKTTQGRKFLGLRLKEFNKVEHGKLIYRV